MNALSFLINILLSPFSVERVLLRGDVVVSQRKPFLPPSVVIFGYKHKVTTTAIMTQKTLPQRVLFVVRLKKTFKQQIKAFFFMLDDREAI